MESPHITYGNLENSGFTHSDDRFQHGNQDPGGGGKIDNPSNVFCSLRALSSSYERPSRESQSPYPFFPFPDSIDLPNDAPPHGRDFISQKKGGGEGHVTCGTPSMVPIYKRGTGAEALRSRAFLHGTGEKMEEDVKDSFPWGTWKEMEKEEEREEILSIDNMRFINFLIEVFFFLYIRSASHFFIPIHLP